MGIQTSAVTGAHFIRAPEVRSKRIRYQKIPLVGPKQTFVEMLIALFSRRPRPFLGSPIADKIDRDLDFSRKVVRAGAVSAVNLERVSDQLREHAAEARRVADGALDEIDDALRQEAAWLDQCRPEEILSNLEHALEKERIDLKTELMPLSRKVITSQIAVEDFQHRYSLSDDLRWGKRFDLKIMGQLGILLALEFIANSVFQADTQARGLLGGVTVALLTSLATVILGLLFGEGFRRNHSTIRGGRWMGLGLLALAFILAFVFVSSLSLIRVAGESGDLHPLETARMQLMTDPLAGVKAMLDLPAFAYTLCIVGLIVSVAIKYLEYFGDFPGYRHRKLEFLDAEDELEGEYENTIDEAGVIVETQSGYLDSAPGFIASCKLPIVTLVTDHENVVDQYKSDIDGIRNASTLFDCFIADYRSEGADAYLPSLKASTTEAMDGYLAALQTRHERFMTLADELCSRDDVSQSTVDAARGQFNDRLDAQLEMLSEEKRKALDFALDDLKRERQRLNRAKSLANLIDESDVSHDLAEAR